MTAPATEAQRREALRQQMLLRVLWRDADAGVLRGQARAPGGHALKDGVTAYRAHAGATAERALAAAYPTVAALVGDEAMAGLARALWQRHPPVRGDLAEWGGALPGFIAEAPSLADEPYLADVARLEWQVHRAARAPDAPDAMPDLPRLGRADPSRLRLRLAPGCALLASRWPVVSIWAAHQRPDDDPARFRAARAALAEGRGETAFVRRDGLRVRVDALDPAAAAWVAALLDGRPLDAALDAAGPAFAFDRWLAEALPARLLATIEPLE